MAIMTTAQALVKFLNNQYVSFDGKETRFVDGICTVFGHGIVCGLGQALDDERCYVVRSVVNIGMRHIKDAEVCLAG